MPGSEAGLRIRLCVEFLPEAGSQVWGGRSHLQPGGMAVVGWLRRSFLPPVLSLARRHGSHLVLPIPHR